MKQLATLYKLTELGRIQQWTMNIDGDSYFSTEGLVDGQLTVNKPTVCLGKNIGKKNETSPEQQAEREASAKHKKKVEKGYCLTQTEAQKGDVGFVEPMLAQNFNDYKDEIVYPVYSQPKLDGIRCIITSEGMFSRNGKKFVSAPHIFEALKPFFKIYKLAILDGELYCDKLSDNFNKICSLVKKTKPTPEELAESAKIIEFWCYDAPRVGIYTETDKFWDRNLFIQKELTNRYPKVKVVETKLVSNIGQLTAIYEKYLEDGYEGQMVRLDGRYENKRSRNLLKRKEFVDAEYEIFGVFEGEGGRVGTVGYMTFYTKQGKFFKSNVKGSFEYLRELWKNRANLIGKHATIKYFSLTPDLIPRFPYIIAIDRKGYE